jgi:hypothetical protein
MTISKWIIPLLNTAILKVETNIIANISASLIGWAGILVIMSVKDFKLTILFFYWWRHNVFYVKLAHASYELTLFLWIRVSSVIQTLSVAHIKGKMSNLPINFNTGLSPTRPYSTEGHCSDNIFSTLNI